MFLNEKNDYISYCGLNCETCEAYIATKNNDDDMRKEVAKKWSSLNNVDVTKEMINCEGCKRNGVKTPFCDYICEIRICAMNEKVFNCGECKEMSNCEKIKMITINNEDALNRLKNK